MHALWRPFFVVAAFHLFTSLFLLYFYFLKGNHYILCNLRIIVHTTSNWQLFIMLVNWMN